jgi:hypothetical protein
MNLQAMARTTAGRTRRTFAAGGIALAAAAPFMLASAVLHAAPGDEATAAGQQPVSLESIPGTAVKRVTLTAKAAERLGIQTSKVSEEIIVPKQMVSGLVVPRLEQSSALPAPSAGGFGGFGPARPTARPSASLVKPVAASLQPDAATSAAPAAAAGAGPASDQTWLLVTLSKGEWERVAKDRPARVLALPTRDKLLHEVLAKPAGIPPVDDMKRTMLSVYYVLPGMEPGLALNNRMRVELQLAGADETSKKVVPYSAVYYDGKGVPWIYVNVKPLTYERQRAGVERIVGDRAVLSEGPAVGTPVVTVGAALLYGSEIFGK